MEHRIPCQSRGHIHARSGWSAAEEELLKAETARAAREGLPLRQAFETVAARTHRRPNSVRNYYYTALRSAEGKPARPPFEPFTDEEARRLLTQMLTAHSRGKSIRACANALAGGDRTLMLRYQNKYRALMQRRPPLVQQVLQQLKAQGIEPPQNLRGDALAARVADEVTDRLTVVLQQGALQSARQQAESALWRAGWYRQAARRLAAVAREYLAAHDPRLRPLLEECIAQSLAEAPGEAGS